MAQQLKIVNLKCPNCGGVLEISGDMERFACGYCGSEQIVERRGGTIGLRLVDAVARIQAGTDKTAAELALVRLDKELASVRAQWEEVDKQFSFRNKPNSDWAPKVLIASALTVFVTLGYFFNLVAKGELDIGSAFVCILLTGAAVVAFICALTLPVIARKRYLEGRAELWIPYAKQIQLVEKQIEMQRRLIHL